MWPLFNNLGMLDGKEQRFTEAHRVLDEALLLYRALAENAPATYRPDVAMTLLNLGVFFGLDLLWNDESAEGI
jgi:hypothetical protein